MKTFQHKIKREEAKPPKPTHHLVFIFSLKKKKLLYLEMAISDLLTPYVEDFKDHFKYNNNVTLWYPPPPKLSEKIGKCSRKSQRTNHKFELKKIERVRYSGYVCTLLIWLFLREIYLELVNNSNSNTFIMFLPNCSAILN